MMRAQAQQLTDARAVFTDLTQLFADHKEQIYMDDCCHVTYEGDVLLAKAIAARIADWYSNGQRPSTSQE